MRSYVVVGMMSGTSLDGLDIAGVKFTFDKNWDYKVLHCETIPYNKEWQERLTNAVELSGFDLKLLDIEYGRFLGQCARHFIDQNQIQAELIASHGHTIFHQPESGITLQIGDGYHIFKATGVKTVCDLRSMDVAFGGQGAPLVPLGDLQLFSRFHFCLNLGGFSNISYTNAAGSRIAYDVCPVNNVLNYAASLLGHAYDKNGEIARKGSLLPDLFDELENLPYYRKPPPKSLGIEWVNDHVFPLIADRSPKDVLHTFCHHIATRISEACIVSRVNEGGIPEMLTTGGGAHNAFLMELIKEKTRGRIHVVVPDRNTVDFKEAIVFAFLGLLKVIGQSNCLRTVTGAETDCSGGLVFYQ